MPANTSPLFSLTPVLSCAQVSVANSNRDGSTGTYVDVVTGAANGTRIDYIRIKAAVTTTAGMVRLFLYDGTSTRLYTEILVTAITASATVASFESSLNLVFTTGRPIILKSGDKIKANTEKAEAINVIAFGGSY